VSLLLEARDLVVERGRSTVLQGASLCLHEGEALALVGPNAAGKSTLLRTMAGLLKAKAGVVSLRGKPFEAWKRDAWARAVALVAAEEDGAPTLAVADRVALGRYPHRGPFRPLTARDHEAVDHALARAGIEHLARRPLGTLSAGERQLAALARGLAQEPEVLLLDEPASHLDIGHQLRLFAVLDEVRRRGVAVLAVVHDLQRAGAWAERMALLAEGRVIDEGPPATVLSGKGAAEAFGVTISAHVLEALPHPLYSFAPPE
jgi:ABC-type cobalamin/Fe3+-siderophores transport system ATPase subunit